MAWRYGWRRAAEPRLCRLIACDGGRSTVRDLLGLALKGMQYDGRYVIVDIEQESQRPIERLAWFDPPSNPGSTILMHRQPENVWRIDYLRCTWPELGPGRRGQSGVEARLDHAWRRGGGTP